MSRARERWEGRGRRCEGGSASGFGGEEGVWEEIGLRERHWRGREMIAIARSRERKRALIYRRAEEGGCVSCDLERSVNGRREQRRMGRLLVEKLSHAPGV